MCLSGLSIVLVGPVCSAETLWEIKAPMQMERSRLGVTQVNGKIYAIGGDNTILMGNCIGPSIGDIVNTTEEYDPQTDTWTFKESMPTPRCSFAIVVYQNKIYCIGGYVGNGSVTGVNEVYDPVTDKWETRTPMPTPRMDLQANVVGDKIYLIGGRIDFLGYLNVNEVYDPATDSWTTKTDAPYRITSGASAAVGEEIFVLATAGRLDLGAFILSYNTEADFWKVCAFSPTYGDWSTTAGVTAGQGNVKIVFFSESATYIYFPESDSWAAGTTMPTARGFSGVAFLDKAFYVIGGIKAPFAGYIVITSSVANNEKYIPNEQKSISQDSKIYIRNDGSVEPSTANITTTNKLLYTFTNNNTGRIIVERNDITIDGNGFTLYGSGSFGIALFQRHNVTIKNITIREFQTAGIGLDSSTQIRIVENNLTDNINNGIRTFCASDNLVFRNNITRNKYMSGIQLTDKSDNNTITENYIFGNSGFIIENSSNNSIFHNNIVEEYQKTWVSIGYSNCWDNSYPSGGNYWNRYNGTDSDNNGIGDMPYIIDADNKDNYPFMAPIQFHSIPLEATTTPLTTPTTSYNPQPTISCTITPNQNITADTEPTPSIPEAPIWTIFAITIILMLTIYTIKKSNYQNKQSIEKT